MRKDEIRVLRDAYVLHLANLDYSVTDDWEGPIVQGLERDGVLEISVVGRILGIKSYRLAPHAVNVAKECHVVFENDRAEALDSLMDAIASLSVGPA